MTPSEGVEVMFSIRLECELNRGGREVCVEFAYFKFNMKYILELCID